MFDSSSQVVCEIHIQFISFEYFYNIIFLTKIPLYEYFRTFAQV